MLSLFVSMSAVSAEQAPRPRFVEAVDQTPIDLEPPLIDHEALTSGRSGEPQSFSALIRDERGVESVQFFYRTTPASDFASIPMRLIPGTENFVVSIETSTHHSAIEYYIEARDTGGNRVLKGFPSRPLVRNLAAPLVLESAPQPSTPAQPAAPASGAPRWLFAVLGAVALGVLLSNSGGDSGSSDPATPMTPLTITATQP